MKDDSLEKEYRFVFVSRPRYPGAHKVEDVSGDRTLLLLLDL